MRVNLGAFDSEIACKIGAGDFGEFMKAFRAVQQLAANVLEELADTPLVLGRLDDGHLGLVGRLAADTGTGLCRLTSLFA